MLENNLKILTSLAQILGKLPPKEVRGENLMVLKGMYSIPKTIKEAMNQFNTCKTCQLRKQ